MSYFSNIVEKDDEQLEFVFNSNKHNDIDKSFVNAIRRTILSEYPTYSFNSEPYQNCDINIITNTSALHNEFISHRIGLLPVNVDPIIYFNEGQYLFEIDVKNDENQIISVTTKDIQIKNLTTNQLLPSDIKEKVFPADPVSNDYIIICKLKPKEEFKCEAKASKNIGKTHASYSPVSKITFFNKVDDEKCANALHELINKKQQEKGDVLSEEEIANIKHKFMIFDSARHFHTNEDNEPNVFQFEMETVGVYSNVEIISNSFDIIKSKMNRYMKALEQNKTDEVEIIQPNTLNTQIIDIIIKFDTHTLGNLLQAYTLKRSLNKTIKWIGYKVPHPLEVRCELRLELVKPGKNIDTNKQIIKELMLEVSNDIISVCNKCQADWNKINNYSKRFEPEPEPAEPEPEPEPEPPKDEKKGVKKKKFKIIK